MIIQWRKYIFAINDIYGIDMVKANIPPADVHCYFLLLDFVNTRKKGSLQKRVKTLCIHLSKDEGQLKKEMNRTTRYQINRVGRDDLSIKTLKSPTKEDIKAFIDFSIHLHKKKALNYVTRIKSSRLERVTN